MDIKVFLASFAGIFVAELADKTQLVGIGLSAKTGKPITVWLGSVAAYALITAISVLLGAAIGRHLRPELLRSVGAALFVIIGILMYIGKI